MRVLVTRPLRSGQRTAKRLRDMGHEPVLLPLSQPVHDGKAAMDALARSHGPIAITSAEAVRALASSGADIRPYSRRLVFAVGEASANEAKAAGFASVLASAGDGARLAELIAAQTRQSVTYLAGSPRAETFERSAHALGLKVDVAECYRMQPAEPDPGALREALTPPPEAIVLYSRTTAERFFRLPEVRSEPGWLNQALILCLSTSVAAAVPASIGRNLRIAALPDERSLLSLL
ncbi:uroporphyrinogen-III synthase [Rhizobium etli 8C-3]|uniref:Uroporphyrinogen-III synthase n=2 Tax=Rhizobium TaxID=379 RepID=A0A4R3QUI1_9HYPH|nr:MULTISPECIES: uroporphyrinogen-III synthase [Rhizobium]APO76648.1 uroporphyrinogen-III synthase [Rhizobium etli 8C-3]TCU23952.1 uroporphyrinogen-III synthase [Rhizobium azibense]TCU36220.1 uroporphyrinogen-III synthase [Rhizobium azibense]